LAFSRVVSSESGKVVADSWKAAFFEASAKENSVSTSQSKAEQSRVVFAYYFTGLY